MPWRSSSRGSTKSRSARPQIASSARTFDSAYGVSGRNGAFSSRRSSPSTAPYMLHEEAKTNRPTPADFAARARLTAPSPLIAYVQLGIDVAERIVRQGGQVDDRVEALERPPA